MHLNRWPALIALSLFLCGALPQLAEEPDALDNEARGKSFALEPGSIKVGKRIEGLTDRQHFDLRVSIGTTVIMLLHSPERTILSQRRSFELDSFEDNLGNSLIADEEDPKLITQGSFGWSPWEAAHRVSVMVNGKKCPDPEANSVRVKGKVRFYVASKNESHEQKNIRFAVGTEVKAGPVECMITKAYQRGQVDEPKRWTRVKLQFEGTWPELASVDFLNSEGRRVKKVHINRSIKYGEDKKLHKSLTYDIETLDESGTIIFNLWTDMDEVEAPVDLKFDLGLSEKSTF